MTDTERKPVAPRAAQLQKRLQACETVTDLFKLAASDDFKEAAHALAPDELAALRQAYREVQSSLDGKVKLETFDGQVLLVQDVGFWHSQAYDNDGVTLTFKPETDQSHRFKALTSSAPIVRFCNNLDEMPTETAPLRVQVKLNPVRDPQRAGQGQRIWSIKRLPMPQQIGVGGSPF